MDKKFKVTVTLDIAKADGTPFHSSSSTWNELDYPGMVMIEGKLVNVLAELVAYAEGTITAAQDGGK